MVCTVSLFFQVELIKKNEDNVTSTIGMIFLPYRYYEPQLYGRRSITTRKRGRGGSGGGYGGSSFGQPWGILFK